MGTLRRHENKDFKTIVLCINYFRRIKNALEVNKELGFIQIKES